MNLVYADAGLASNLGHHAQSCRVITGAMRAAGHDVQVFGNVRVPYELSAELGIRSTFRFSCYDRPNADPVAGWLHDFLTLSGRTTDDLLHVAPNGAAVYWNSAQPAQLHALLLYLNRCRESRAVLEFGTGPGLAVTLADTGELRAQFLPPDQNADGVLYRYCSFLLTDDVRERLTLVTFNDRTSALFSSVLDCPVQTFPIPRDGPETVRLRGKTSAGTDAPLTVSFLGHQRGEKGYHLVPAVVRRVLTYAKWQTRPVRFLIHNGGKQTPAEQDEVRRLTVEYPDVVDVDEREADGTVWQELLDRSDLIVCPYHPEAFLARYSAVAAEAVANGIPLIVPQDSTLADLALGMGGGTVFPGWEPAHIAAATISGIETFEVLAGAAFLGAGRWRERHGGAKTAAAIVESLQ